MKNKALKRQPLYKGQKGFLTLDFIFATVLMFSFSAILFLFSITFTVMEVAQYAVYSSARSYFAAAMDESMQRRAAEDKFTQLVLDSKAPLGTFFRNGWFTIDKVVIDDFNEDFSDDPDKDSGTFIGARATVKANVLKTRVPLLGQVTKDMSASPSAYLMREPTLEECKDFSAQRMQHIQNLKDGFSNGFVKPTDYIMTMDDGC